MFKDEVFVPAAIILYFIITTIACVVTYRLKKREAFKNAFTAWVCTFTGIIPVAAVMIGLVVGFGIGIMWLFFEKIPGLITRNFNE